MDDQRDTADRFLPRFDAAGLVTAIVIDAETHVLLMVAHMNDEAIVHEEEDELRLPGSLPSQCDRLCPQRASLSGLRLPRASWSAADAGGLRMYDRQGNIGRPCGG